jgi:hypothetical protein
MKGHSKEILEFFMHLCLTAPAQPFFVRRLSLSWLINDSPFIEPED